jgi:hypothetical protein
MNGPTPGTPLTIKLLVAKLTVMDAPVPVVEASIVLFSTDELALIVSIFISWSVPPPVLLIIPVAKRVIL